MGKNNKRRRAEKARRRERGRGGNQGWRSAAGESSSGRPSGSAGWGGANGFSNTEEERITAMFGLNRLARGRGDAGEVADTVAQLVRFSPKAVARALELDLARILPSLWRGGWLPGEVIRQVKRVTSANGERLVAAAVAADHADRAPTTLHPVWCQHVEGLGLPPIARAGDWLRSATLTETFTTPLDWPSVVDLASSIAFELCSLTQLPEIVPPPGAVATERSIIDLTRQVDDPILTKVRQLLAQAESTSFDAEAETFTAKAQELMARHAIDAAIVWDRQERTETPITTRIAVDEPYVAAKDQLLAVVANESQCQAAIHTRYAMVSIVGFESDVVWCDTLFTSLLVQAQRELTRAGASSEAGGRRRSRSFRSSFLMGYADRIGERLAEVNAHVQDNAAHAGSEFETGALLPVLASRRSAVTDEVKRHFGELEFGPSHQISDPLGLEQGRRAADRADLTRANLENANSA